MYLLHISLFIGVFIGLIFFLEVYCKADVENYEERYAPPLPHDQLFLEIPNFLTPEECDAIIAAAKPNMTQSTVLNPSGTGNIHSDQRLSDQAWISNTDPVVAKMVEKAQEVSGLPLTHFESVQVVRYKEKGRYDPHYDSCNHTDDVCQDTNPRRWTLLVYLNDNYTCGGTRFPRIGDYTTIPQKGKALLFRVSDENGLIYQDTIHGGNPVCEGEKWIATQWVHLNPVSHDEKHRLDIKD